MLKKLSERFPAAASRLESLAGAASPGAASATDPPAAPAAASATDAGATASTDGERAEPSAASPPPALFPPPEGADQQQQQQQGKSEEQRSASFKAALAERINSESVSAAAAVAATSMFGFMKKAQSVATVAAREGAAKATVWKNKALDAADMDALQRRLSYALDRSSGEVNLDLLNFSYVTDNIVAMGFPSMNLGTNRTLLRDNPIDLVAMYLNTKHAGHYMIWNLSEETYDYAYFDNQVLEFNFPGHPAPPLGLMFKICSSIENWLLADDNNLAAVHCLTGKGRTGTVIACYLAWIGQFSNAMESLEYVAERRNSSVEKLTIPSQRRYIQYFNNVMDGVKPRSSPLLLKRVIINTIPVFGTRRVLEPAKQNSNEGTDGETSEAAASEGAAETNEADEEVQEKIEEGCCPYLQIFKGGKLVFTTTWRDMENGNGVQWASTSDGSVSFNVNCMLQGDILVRCRHLTDAGERVSMFRGAFHTGYIPQGILRLTKAQLDGACGDSRFDQDFFVDLIFADVETDGATENGEPVAKSEGVALTEEDKQAYEDMLHRDEAFWVDIEARKVRLQKLREEQQKKKEAAAAAAAAASAAEAAAKAEAEAEAARKAEQAKQKAADRQSSFSITGGDEDVKKSSRAVNRRGSWDEEKDKELMSELESLTAGSLAEVAASLDKDTAASGEAKVTDEMAGLAKEFDEMKKLEKELGLAAYSSELADLSDSKLDPQLELLDKELQGLDGLSPKGDVSADDVMNFGADDFDELEEYLSGLQSSSKP